MQCHNVLIIKKMKTILILSKRINLKQLLNPLKTRIL